MDPRIIAAGLADIALEQDATVKCLKLASLCTSLWAERNVGLVVVGGSAIEILTEGTYVSGDLDLCNVTSAHLALRERQEIMGLLGAKGGPRNWQVSGMFVDLLGPVESFARTPFRRIKAPYGEVLLMKPEDLLVERVLVSEYPEKNQTAREYARDLAVVALGGALGMNWNEVLRVASLPEYRNVDSCKDLVTEVANELKIKSPFYPD